MRQNNTPLASLHERFPLSLQASRATFEVQLDDNSKLLVIPLQAGGLALQCWRPGQARDGHGYLLSGSVMLSETEMDRLIDSMVLRRRVA